MKIYINVGHIIAEGDGHIEGKINFTKEEEKEFKMLIKKNLIDLTEEECNKLEKYKKEIILNTIMRIDNYNILDYDDLHWEDF